MPAIIVMTINNLRGNTLVHSKVPASTPCHSRRRARTARTSPAALRDRRWEPAGTLLLGTRNSYESPQETGSRDFTGIVI